MPEVSILTPAHNHSRFLAQCVRSVLDQTFTNWEMAIVDDGSTDDTLEVARSFSDGRIKVIAQEHGGIEHLADTYNKALAASTGSYVAILEGDDYWPPDKLAVQTAAFEDGVVLVTGRRTIVDEHGQPVRFDEHIPLTAELRNEPLGLSALALMDHKHLTFAFPVATMVRRSALDQIGGFQQPSYLPVVDLPTFVKLAGIGQFRWLDHVCGFWRRHDASATKSRLPEILDGVYRFAGEWLATELPKLDLPIERVEEFRNGWGAYMVHRAVLLSHELWLAGRRDEARRAADLACQFDGPIKRKMKARVARFFSRYPVSDKNFRLLTGLQGASNFLPPFDRLVDDGMVDRVQVWNKS